MATKKKLLEAASGNAGGAGLNVEDVFSTYLYTGTDADGNQITNAINLSDEGGLVWLKARDTANSNVLYDTERGVGNFILTNSNNAQESQPSGRGLVSFNNNGFTLNSDYYNQTNQLEPYASWTFRKAPKFFDVVTYTGDGSTQNISHNLGSAPGMMLIKATSASKSWSIYHRSVGATAHFYEFGTTTPDTSSSPYNDTEPTSTVFTVGTNLRTNDTGVEYVAYLFAHNDGDGDFGPNGDADIIKCGSYTGNGSADGPEIDLGFEPQWVLLKGASAASNWLMYDVMRGLTVGTTNAGPDQLLQPHTANAEYTDYHLSPTQTGFKVRDTGGDTNASGNTYIYIAIRRGPMAVPESGTEVFLASTNASSSSGPVQTGFPVDLFMNKATLAVTSSPRSWWVFDRMRGPSKQLSTDSTAAEPAFDYSPYINFDSNDSFTQTSSNSDLGYFFRRAPSFFDVVAYTGNGVAGRTVSHNLGVAPDLTIIKRRDSTGDWYVCDSLNNQLLLLAQSNAAFDSTILDDYYGDGASLVLPNSTDITVTNNINVNASGGTYIAYLFASLDGVSKVGSYTGNGGTQIIDCGFTSGARFVLIKRSNGTGDWRVLDTERGIVSGNDSYLSLNSTAAEETLRDDVDPHSSGFIVSSADSDFNEYLGEYIYYAIA